MAVLCFRERSNDALSSGQDRNVHVQRTETKVCVSVCVCVCACVRACVRACMCVYLCSYGPRLVTPMFFCRNWYKHVVTVRKIVVFLLDTSAAMGDKLQVAKHVVSLLIQSVNPTDEVRRSDYASFTSQFTVVIILQPITKKLMT